MLLILALGFLEVCVSFIYFFYSALENRQKLMTSK